MTARILWPTTLAVALVGCTQDTISVSDTPAVLKMLETCDLESVGQISRYHQTLLAHRDQARFATLESRLARLDAAPDDTAILRTEADCVCGMALMRARVAMVEEGKAVYTTSDLLPSLPGYRFILHPGETRPASTDYKNLREVYSRAELRRGAPSGKYRLNILIAIFEKRRFWHWEMWVMKMRVENCVR